MDLELIKRIWTALIKNDHFRTTRDRNMIPNFDAAVDMIFQLPHAHFFLIISTGIPETNSVIESAGEENVRTQEPARPYFVRVPDTARDLTSQLDIPKRPASVIAYGKHSVFGGK